jgi:hypothetical protein
MFKNSSKMRKIIVLSVVFTTLFAGNAAAQFQGTFGMGTHVAFGFDRHNVGGGFHIHYYATNNLRIAPSATFFLPQNDITSWKAELDVHVVAPLTFSTVVYPIAGVSYTNRRWNASAIEDAPSGSWTRHRMGGNFGIGLQHDIIYRVRVNFELKYHLIPDYSQVGFMVGIGFWI